MDLRSGNFGAELATECWLPWCSTRDLSIDRDPRVTLGSMLNRPNLGWGWTRVQTITHYASATSWGITREAMSAVAIRTNAIQQRGACAIGQGNVSP
jgi:hypothetical protein